MPLFASAVPEGEGGRAAAGKARRVAAGRAEPLPAGAAETGTANWRSAAEGLGPCRYLPEGVTAMALLLHAKGK